MSIAMMRWVWDQLADPGNERLVLLALVGPSSRDDGSPLLALGGHHHSYKSDSYPCHIFAHMFYIRHVKDDVFRP